MAYYKGIREINGIPVEEIQLKVAYEMVFVDKVTVSLLLRHYKGIEYFFYEKGAERKKHFWEEEDFVDETWRPEIKITKEQAMSALIAQEMGNSYGKKVVRDEEGKFGKNNTVAYKEELSPALAYLLKELGVSVKDIADTFEVTRNTVYARIREWEMK